MEQPVNAGYDPDQYGPQPAPGWQAGAQQGRRITPDQLSSVSPFEDGQDGRLWLSGLYRKAGIYQEDMLDVATSRLGAKASVWQTGHAREHLHRPAFEASFLRRFGLKVEQLAYDLAHCHQSPKESVRAYADRYRELMAKLGIDGNHDPVHRHNFMRGLREDIYREVYFMKPWTTQSTMPCTPAAPRSRATLRTTSSSQITARRTSGSSHCRALHASLRAPKAIRRGASRRRGGTAGIADGRNAGTTVGTTARRTAARHRSDLGGSSGRPRPAPVHHPARRPEGSPADRSRTLGASLSA
jgi:hypothetical protein